MHKNLFLVPKFPKSSHRGRGVTHTLPLPLCGVPYPITSKELLSLRPCPPPPPNVETKMHCQNLFLVPKFPKKSPHRGRGLAPPTPSPSVVSHTQSLQKSCSPYAPPPSSCETKMHCQKLFLVPNFPSLHCEKELPPPTPSPFVGSHTQSLQKSCSSSLPPSPPPPLM